MTSVIIDDVLPYVQFTATAGQTVFDGDFTVDALTDVVVYARATGVAPNDVTQLINPIDYTVTLVGTSQTVRVTFGVGRTLDDVVTITRLTPADRDNVYTNTNFIPSMLNGDIGRLVMMIQQNMLYWSELQIRYNTNATVVPIVDTILPIAIARQGFRKNEANTGFEAAIFVTGEELASHTPPYGATMVGLSPTGTVQDMANQKFILQTPSATMPNAQALSDLTTGIMKSSATTGVISISAPLTSIDSLTIASDKMLYGTGANTYALTDLTAFGRSLLDDANAAGGRATLGLIIGTDVQAYDATLQSISALGTAADKMIYTTGIDTWAEMTATSYSRGLMANVDLAAWQTALGIPGGGGAYFAIANNLSEGIPATMRSNLGLVIGTDVQAFDATLQSLSALGTMSDKIAYTTGVDTWAETGITALGRSLIDDATQADMNTTIGSVPLAGGTMTGQLILSGSPATGGAAATKDYVDSVSQNNEPACFVATEADLPTWTYDNGTAGVGATLTAPANGASTIDGEIPVDGDRVLLLNQSSNLPWQGAYTIVQGTAGTPTVFTRATDYDTPAEINADDIFSVVAGTTYAATQWMNSQTTNPVIIGTTDITFNQLTGQGALLKANNLSDLPSASTARTNLGLVIGTDVQAQDATLQSIAALGTAANKMIYTTALDTWAETDISALGRTLLADTTASAMRTTTGTVIGTDVQAQDATLQSLSALGTVADRLAYTTGVDTWAETPLTAAARTVLDDTTVGAMRTTLGAAASGANSDITALTGLTTALSMAQGGTGLTSMPSISCGRLTLVTGVPVTVSDATAATTLYYTPFNGNVVSIYDGTRWKLYNLTEISIAIPATTSQMYDVFLYDNAGTLTLELVSWTNDTTRATTVAYVDGVIVKTGDSTRKYLGSIRTTTVSGQCEDSQAKRYCYNNYNRVRRPVKIIETANSWTYSTSVYRQANANAANQLDFIQGTLEDAVEAWAIGDVVSSAGNLPVITAIGLDSTTTKATSCYNSVFYVSTDYVCPVASFRDFPQLGRQTLTWLEYGGGTFTQTWLGDNGGTTNLSGINGIIMAQE